MKFSIGYNYDIKMLDLIGAYKDNIEAFYFPIPQLYLGSGRDQQEPKSYTRQIPKIIRKCNTLNIRPQLLLNATCEGVIGLSGTFFNNILDYVKRLRDKGLSSVVVTNPIYISKIKKEISGIIIESSVNCYMKTVEHALYLKDLGVDVLTIDRDINRSINLIKEIKKRTGLQIRVMLNEGCLGNCPYRVNHYNYLSHREKSRGKIIEGVFPDKFCIEVYLKNSLKVFRVPFIPPDALDCYDKFVNHYKLSTRVFSTKRIELCLKAYISKHFRGNLLEILDCPGLSYFEYIDYDILVKNYFFKKMLNCNLKCDTCGYCESLFKKAVLIKRNNSIKRDKGDERKAIRIYKNELKSACDDGNKILAYLKLGEAYLKLHKHKEAIKNIRRVFKLNYKGGKAYLILGLCYEALRHYKKAIEALIKAKEMNLNDNRVSLALMKCYKKAGKIKLFNKEADKIIRGVKFRRNKNSIE
ncbi:MAG: hypothetical protein ABIH08_03810 [Candidatus Omnitrophota bacterium]